MSATNGGSPRLDRIEKMLERQVERQGALAESVELLVAEGRRTDQRIAELVAAGKRTDVRMNRTDERLKRAIALAAKEDLAQRKRTNLLQAEMKKLAIAMKLFLSSRPNGNGHGRKS